LDAYSKSEDVLDSNAGLTISGGVVRILCKTNGNGAFDVDGTFAVTGGTLVAFYYNTNLASSPSTTATTQPVAIISGSYAGSAGTTFAVKDSSSNVVFASTIPSSNYSSSMVCMISSPDMEKGSTYYVYKGVTASGGTSFDGLYYGYPTVSGGSKTTSFTFSSYVYGASSNNQMFNFK
ncbi:MAG: hypothetical protein K5634_00655, partial [Sphaerochaetaceae bacterium]|nr:hypothetical protein [Sphaerochaetaceae bacterium]